MGEAVADLGGKVRLKPGPPLYQLVSTGKFVPVVQDPLLELCGGNLVITSSSSSTRGDRVRIGAGGNVKVMVSLP